MTGDAPWVAVDGGQTGLRLRAGATVRIGHGPGFAYADGDPVGSIVAAVRAAALDAGLSGPVGVACLGLTGYPREQAGRLGAALAAALSAAEVRLAEDMVTAHAGALPDGHGVALVAGTGVVCLALDDAGHHKVDGHGHLFGDAGSGFAIGRAGLRAVLAALDGRGGPTALTGLARLRFGPLGELAHRIYTGDAPVAAVARFAEDVIAAAAEGDDTAGAIVADAADELARTAATAVGTLAGDGPVPVAHTGQLFAAGDPLLSPLRRRLAELAPRARLRPAAGDPLDGAVRLATGPPGRYADLLHVSRTSQPPPAVSGRRNPTAAPDNTSREMGSTVDGLPFPARALLVSCQARPGNPLRDAGTMATMAEAAAAGGALGIRANGPADVAAIRSAVPLPVIGINKQGDPGGVSITPTFEAAAAVVRAGAAVVAVDGTRRARPDGGTLAGQIGRIHDELGVPVMADVDDLEAGLAARAAGADLVASTLSGYTGGAVPAGPDVALVARLAARLDCPVVAEGRYRTGTQVRAALDAGAYAVVVGTAITNPMAITRRLVRATR